MKRSSLLKALAAVMLSSLILACAPVVEFHGYFPDARKLATIKEGSHTKRELELLMGSPSAIASFDENMWFYINSQQHTFAWKAPVVVSRQILAISFNEETSVIESVNNYSIEDGRLIAFSDDITPTRGRELSFIEQLLGNVGRVSTETLEEQQNR